MNPDVKVKWTAALRSGEYKQTQGRLRGKNRDNETGYCCLGVLCDIAVKEGVVEWNEVDGIPTIAASGERWSEEHGVPREVREWAGLTDDSGNFDSYFRDSREIPGTSLISLNDGYGFNFSEIADVIEEKF